MLRLKSKLLSLNAQKTQKTKVFSPANCEELRIPIHVDKMAKVVGKLAERIRLGAVNSDEATNGENKKRAGDDVMLDGQTISGVLVQNDLKLSLMDPEDLREYAGLTTTVITCRQRITLAAAGIELIRWALEGTFGGILDLSISKDKAGPNGNNGIKDEEEDADEEIDREEYKFLVMDTVTVSYRNRGEIEVEWEGNMMNDGIADAVLAVLLSVESSPAAVKRTCSFPHRTSQ